ncbi:hypothetical protein PG994_001165 [Apiospora phragmitis]|uniref:Uncharacterized protein n=1 Tax=Apiospora phragmitis TaxID=2905665 RepID=A0ABR1WSR2_9PEZI
MHSPAPTAVAGDVDWVFVNHMSAAADNVTDALDKIAYNLRQLEAARTGGGSIKRPYDEENAIIRDEAATKDTLSHITFEPWEVRDRKEESLLDFWTAAVQKAKEDMWLIEYYL